MKKTRNQEQAGRRSHLKKLRGRVTMSACLLLMSIGLAGCGSNSNSSSPSASGTAGSKANEQAQADTSAEAQTEAQTDAGNKDGQELTLADGVAKLIYMDDAYISLMYYGPYEDTGKHLEDKNGESLGSLFREWTAGNEAWGLFTSEEFPGEGHSADDVLLSVTDYSVSSEPEEFYPLTETLTEEEAETIGLDVLEGHIGSVLAGEAHCDGHGFEAPRLYIFFYDEYHDEILMDMDGLADRFSFYTEDGTPLEEWSEDCTMERETKRDYISLYFKNKDKDYNAEANEAMCEEFRALKPYALYTAKDGTTKKFPLFPGE